MPSQGDRRSTGPAAPRDRGPDRTWIVLALILAVAALLRVAYLTELVRQPDFASPTADAAFHDYWARGLATGDWTVPPGTPDPHIPDRPFLRPPGYPHFLALLYLLTGGSHLGARILQMLLGVVNLLLLFLLARAIFGRRAGLIAAALGTLYWAFPFYEGELQAPVFVIPLILGMFLAIHAWLRQPRWPSLALAGLLLGIASVERANLLLLLPAGAAWTWWIARRRGIAGGWRHPALWLGAGLLAIAPVTARNLAKGDFVLVSTNGPINLYIGNNDAADGSSLRIPGLLELSGQQSWSMFAADAIAQGVARKVGRPMKHSEVASWFGARAREWIAAHPGRFLQLTLRRAALFWGPKEVSNNKAGQFEKAASRTLRFLFPFPAVLALGLLGAGWVVWDRRAGTLAGRGGGRGAKKGGGGAKEGLGAANEACGGVEEGEADPASGRLTPAGTALLAAIGGFVLVYFASYLPFIVADRFRVPIVPLILAPAGWAIARTVALWRARRTVAGAIAVAAAGAIFGLCSISFARYEPDKAWWHTDRGLAYDRIGKTEEALREFFAALKANPGYVDGRLALGQTMMKAGRANEAVPHFQSVAQARPDRTDVRLELGSLLLELNRMEEAEAELRSLVRDHPDLSEGHRLLGKALLARGRPEEALAKMRRALALRPETADASIALGNDLKALGATGDAESAFRRAQEIDPRRVEPIINLGNLRFEERKLEEALRLYRQAVELSPKSVTARVNLAGALFTKGDRAAAAAEVEEVLRLDPKYEPALRLRSLLAAQGRPASLSR